MKQKTSNVLSCCKFWIYWVGVNTNLQQNLQHCNVVNLYLHPPSKFKMYNMTVHQIEVSIVSSNDIWSVVSFSDKFARNVFNKGWKLIIIRFLSLVVRGLSAGSTQNPNLKRSTSFHHHSKRCTLTPIFLFLFLFFWF